MQGTHSLIAPKRPPRQPSASDVESFNSAKALLDGLVTDIGSIDQVSTSLIDQLHEDRSRIAQEVRHNMNITLTELFHAKFTLHPSEAGIDWLLGVKNLLTNLITLDLLVFESIESRFGEMGP